MNVLPHPIVLVTGIKNTPVLQLSPKQYVLFSDFVITDKNSPDYNEFIMKQYLDNHYLAKVELTFPNMAFTGYNSFILTIL
jgi:hypothetical protein